MPNKLTNPAFTLIELLLYFLIFGTIVATISLFAFQISSGRMQSLNHLELQENGRLILKRIGTEIKEAQSIDLDSSVFNSNPGTLVLQKYDPAESPTTFEIQNNVLYLTQGINGPYALTNNEVIVESLIFTNLTTTKSPENIKISLTLRHINPSARTEFDASVTLEESVSVRKG